MKSQFLMQKIRIAERLLGQTGTGFFKTVYPPSTPEHIIRRMAERYYKWQAKEDDAVTEDQQFFDHLSEALRFDGDPISMMTCDIDEFIRRLPEQARKILEETRQLAAQTGISLSTIFLDPYYNFERLLETSEREFRNGRLDQKLLYMGTDSVRRWKDMIGGGKYHTHEDCLAAVSSLLETPAWKSLFHSGKFNSIVDLGAGTATKTKRIVEDYLVHVAGNLKASVIDTSLYMLDAASMTFSPLVAENADRLLYRGYRTDFSDLRGISDMIKAERGSVFFSLGSTFANASEHVLVLALSASVLLAVFLSTYTAAQWLAGEKFLGSAFSLTTSHSLAIFGLSIVLYSSIGGFRGSVYTDLFQAMVRLIGTVIALAAVIYSAVSSSESFWININNAGNGFLLPFPSMTTVGIFGFVIGFASAAIGFGLGQPQIVSRYFAASSPAEAKAARWIYIGFIQFTWLSMTLFGVVLRGVIPGIADPETGLVVFANENILPVATGIIFADIFATIASTSNGLLVAISQIIVKDLVAIASGSSRLTTTAATFLLGVVTIVLSFILPGNVYSIAIDAVSMIAAGLGGPVIIKAFSARHSAESMLASFLTGLLAAAGWKLSGFSATLNEAGIGLAISLLTNFAFVHLQERARVAQKTSTT